MLIDMADRGLLPDRLIRMGIRFLDKQRLAQEDRSHSDGQRENLDRFIAHMHESPIAVHTNEANEQHYEVPAVFFTEVLGKHMKYSGCYWPEGVKASRRGRRGHAGIDLRAGRDLGRHDYSGTRLRLGIVVFMDGTALPEEPHRRRVELGVPKRVYQRQGGLNEI